MNKIVVFLALALPLCAFGQGIVLQHPRTIYMASDSLNFNYEFSSLAFSGDTVLLFSEKCHRLVKAMVKPARSSKERDSLKIVGRILHISSEPGEIEGVSSYKGTLLVCDEKLGKVWQYRSGSFDPVALGPNPFAAFGNNDGLEGIATDEQSGSCWLLREINNNKHPELYCYKLSIGKNGKAVMEQRNPFRIELPVIGAHCRYSDIYFDSENRLLLLLMSCYDEVNHISLNYGVDGLVIDGTGRYDTGRILHLAGSPELADSVKSAGKAGLENNIEGFALLNGALYIISDNRQVDSCEERRGKHPLMLKVTYNGFGRR